MLQRAPYMTAEALGIDPNEHQALVAVLGKLERGELRYAPMMEETTDEFGDACGFNMAEWHCGTVHCIGGWVEKILGHSRNEYQYPINLYKLYYPETMLYYGITSGQAAQALRNYLTYGAADWAGVLAP